MKDPEILEFILGTKTKGMLGKTKYVGGFANEFKEVLKKHMKILDKLPDNNDTDLRAQFQDLQPYMIKSKSYMTINNQRKDQKHIQQN